MDDLHKAAETGTPQVTGPATAGFNALKADRLFVVFSDNGDILGPDADGRGIMREGMFRDDMRLLSRLRIRVGGRTPIFMRASVDRLNTCYEALLSNDGLEDEDGASVPAQSLILTHSRTVDGVMQDRLTVRSFLDRPVSVAIEIELHADFLDIFEVRGVPRSVRGRNLLPQAAEREVSFRHEAPDGVLLETRVGFDRPVEWTGSSARFVLSIDGNASVEVSWRVGATEGRGAQAAGRSARARDDAPRTGVSEARFHRLLLVTTDNPAIDAWLERSAADLSMLLTDTAEGPYPYAGLPWFATHFGRDGLITAMQTLWCDPTIARGVLAFLAARQADGTDPAREAQPGKMLHEVRHGEMARLGQTPYALYYGGVDQTLLFVMLAGRYLARTGDTVFIRRIMPHVEKALAWAATHGDPDGDGLVEHPTDSPTGLRNQGWKDSANAIFHDDGRIAEGPIALVEVQAYHVDALRSAASLHRHLGDTETAVHLDRKAEALVEVIDRKFWMSEHGLWAMALDGEKRQVRTLSSNAAHVLFAGAALPKRHAEALATLSSPKMRSGFGLRTVSSDAALYNPMHYHVGSIWPHDTSIAAAGAARVADVDLAAALFDDLLAAAGCFPDNRLPELFCGFDRSLVSKAAPYYSACAPQAWAAGAPFLMIQALLGIDIDALSRRVILKSPRLPQGVDLLSIRRLPLAGRRLDLNVRRAGKGATLEVVSAPADTNFVFRR